MSMLAQSLKWMGLPRRGEKQSLWTKNVDGTGRRKTEWRCVAVGMLRGGECLSII